MFTMDPYPYDLLTGMPEYTFVINDIDRIAYKSTSYQGDSRSEVCNYANLAITDDMKKLFDDSVEINI